MSPLDTPSPTMKLKKNKNEYHKSAPEIPGGLVLLSEWAKSKGISPNCAQKWVWAGKLPVFRVPGYGLRCFIKPSDGEKAMKPVPAVPRIAQ